MVIQKRYIHQRGSGLLYSASVSSHTWPCSPTSPFSRLVMFDTSTNTPEQDGEGHEDHHIHVPETADEVSHLFFPLGLAGRAGPAGRRRSGADAPPRRTRPWRACCMPRRRMPRRRQRPQHGDQATEMVISAGAFASLPEVRNRSAQPLQVGRPRRPVRSCLRPRQARRRSLRRCTGRPTLVAAPSCVLDVARRRRPWRVEPGEGRHVRLRHHVARVEQVHAVPLVGVATADAGQVRPGPLEPHWNGWS